MQPIRGQCSCHVISIDQSEASITKPINYLGCIELDIACIYCFHELNVDIFGLNSNKKSVSQLSWHDLYHLFVHAEVAQLRRYRQLELVEGGGGDGRLGRLGAQPDKR